MGLSISIFRNANHFYILVIKFNKLFRISGLALSSRMAHIFLWYDDRTEEKDMVGISLLQYQNF